jgi:hypothetical protein
MKITIVQTIIKTFDLDRTLLNSRTVESYVIEPDADKILVNKLTGQKFSGSTCVNQERKISNYIEIEKEES